MFIRDDEKDLHNAAIDKLIDAVVNTGIGEKLGKLRKPIAASVSIEKMPEDSDDASNFDSHEDMEDDDDDEDMPSPEELAEIERKYKKYCHGGEI